MKGVLQKIPPLHAPLIPPMGSVPAGLTPDGLHQLFKLDRPRSTSEPDKDAETGQQRYRRHATTGEPMIKVRKPVLYVEHLLFYLESQGNGNNVMVPYVPPTDQELAKAARDRKVAAMKEGLAEALVDAGYQPHEVLAALQQGAGLPQASDAGPEAPEATVQQVKEPETYPKDMGGGGWWLLSNGEKFHGKEDAALSAEKEVLEVRAAASQTPAV